MPITSNKLQQIWGELDTRIIENKSQGILEKNLIYGDIGLSAIVRAKDMMPGILIRINVPEISPRWNSIKYAGVHFDALIRDNSSILLPVMLAKKDALSVFSTFTADIATSIDEKATPRTKLSSLLSKISLWQRFFKKGTSGLSEEQVRGLFGELELFNLIIEARGFDTAFDGWKGPDAGLHDYELQDVRIEAKTWMNPASPKIVISEPGQIIVDKDWPVYLFAVQLGKNTLNSCNLKCLMINMNFTKAKFMSESQIASFLEHILNSFLEY